MAGRNPLDLLSGYFVFGAALIAEIALLILLFISMIFDLRRREVPTVLTVGTLAGAAVLAIFQQLWSPVVLTIALILISDFHPRAKRLAFGLTLSLFAGIFQPALFLICLVILAVWLLWEFEVMGGADVKLLIAVSLFTGSPAALIPIAVIGGIQGVIASFRKQREIPFVLSIFFGTLFFVLFPLILK